MGTGHAEARPQVRFAVSANTVAENVGTVRIEVIASETATADYFVGFSVTGGLDSGDFVGIFSEPTSWTPGVTIRANQTSGFYDLPVFNDPWDEIVETGTLLISPGGSTYDIVPPSSYSLTILADNTDPRPTVEFISQGIRIHEDAGVSGPANLAIVTATVELSEISGRIVTVPWSVAGTATRGVDYTGLGSGAGTLTFLPRAKRQTITFTVVDDSEEEDDETVILNLGTPVNAGLGGRTTQTTTIVNEDVTVSWAYIATNLVEGGSGLLPLTLSRPLSWDLQVWIRLTEISNPQLEFATKNFDFTFGEGFYMVPAGWTTLEIPTQALEDRVTEGTEVFYPTIHNFGGSIGIAAVRVNIQDNDPPPAVSFVLAQRGRSEATADRVVDVYLDRPSSRSVQVGFTVSGSALQPADYSLNSPVNQTLVFAPGETLASIVLTVVGDFDQENNETVIFTLQNPVNCTLGAILAHTLTIENDDALPTVSFAVSSLNISEPNNPALDITPLDRVANIAVRLSSPASTRTVVEVVTPLPQIGEGGGYSIGTGRLFFDPGETTKNIAVRVGHDRLDEDDLAIDLALQTPSGLVREQTGETICRFNAAAGQVICLPVLTIIPGLLPSGTSICRVNVLDNDAPPVVRFTADEQLVREVGLARVNLQLSAPSGRTVRGTVTTAEETAKAGFDYDASGTSLYLFAPGSVETPVHVNIVTDNEVEPDESFYMNLSTVENATIGAPSSAHIFILDDDASYITPAYGGPAVVSGSGFDVEFRKAAAGVTLSNVDGADALLALPLPNASVAFVLSDDGATAINYVDAATDPVPQGDVGGDRDIHLVPGSPSFAAGDVDHFAMRASGFLIVERAGNWTLGVRSDDGFRLRLAGQTVLEYASPRGPDLSSRVVQLGTGVYPFDLTYFEQGGGAQVEFIARPPQGSIFRLVGDSLLPLRVAGSYELVAQNIRPLPEPLSFGQPGHLVRFRQSSFDQADITAAAGLFALGVSDSRVLREATDHYVQTINYLDSGPDGFFGSSRSVSSPPLISTKGTVFTADGEDNFAMKASGTLRFPTAGIWGVGVHSDDAFELRLGNSLPVVSSFPNPRGPAATTNWIQIVRPGWYPYELLYNEWGGGAEVEFFTIPPGGVSPALVGSAESGVQVMSSHAFVPPRLAIAKVGDYVEVRWPTNAVGWAIQQRSSWMSGDGWFWQNAVVSGPNWIYRAPAVGDYYYRLAEDLRPRDLLP